MAADRSRGYAIRMEIAAPASRIWTALTATSLLAEWFKPRAEIDARPGGSFKVTLDGGIERHAHIDVFTPPSRLRLIYLPQPEWPAIETVIVDDFMIDGSNSSLTRLSLLGSGFPRQFEFAEFFQQTQGGWNRGLNRMKVLLERPVAAKVK
jgi:uncharacterized protein YndB with AHSA1/START domain